MRDIIRQLPFNAVMNLYNKRLKIEAYNDISARTHLLRVYPEIFNPELFQEIKIISDTCINLVNKHRKKSIMLENYRSR